MQKTLKYSPMYSISLPLPPLLNNFYGHHCRSHYATVYVKKDGKLYKNLVKELVIKQDFQLRANIPLDVTLLVFFKSSRRTDLDGVLKCFLDAATESEIWLDDSLIDKLTVIRGGVDRDNPRVELTIAPYTKKDKHEAT